MQSYTLGGAGDEWIGGSWGSAANSRLSEAGAVDASLFGSAGKRPQPRESLAQGVVQAAVAFIKRAPASLNGGVGNSRKQSILISAIGLLNRRTDSPS